MTRLALIHYQPLEYYPPVMNTLNYLGDSGEILIKVFTSNNNKRNAYSHDKLKIARFPFPNNSANKLSSLAMQVLFNAGTFIYLIFYRPQKILYYETYAAFPVYLYSKFINRKVKVFIHFHEYFPPEWYATGMKLVEYYHKLEEDYLFRKATWISHTNSDRIKLFQSDYPYISNKVFCELPNYPPKSWQKKSNTKSNTPTRMVYVGSLSLKSTYVQEFCEWVMSKNGKFKFDIYCYNTDAATHQYLCSLGSEYISYYAEGIDYYDLPGVLIKYDVGVILYKAATLNFRYNAPNKLFEYLACDLDVWFPDTMEGIMPFISEQRYPKVLKLNFSDLTSFNSSRAIDRSNLSYKKSEFYSENVNSSLLKNLTL